MAVVIHTIKGNQYAYDHHREGDRVVSTYIGPVGGGGGGRGSREVGGYNIREPIHGGGAPKKQEVQEVTQQEVKQKVEDQPKVEEKRQEKVINSNRYNIDIADGQKVKQMEYKVEGNSYPVKDQLKEAGFKWDADKKAWTTSDSSKKDLVEKMGLKLSKQPSREESATELRSLVRREVQIRNEKKSGLHLPDSDTYRNVKNEFDSIKKRQQELGQGLPREIVKQIWKEEGAI